MSSAVNNKNIEEIINGLKSGTGLWEDLSLKSSRFSSSIKSMSVACGDFINCLNTICDMTSKTNCGLRSTGINLTKLLLRERNIELKVSKLSNALSDNFVGELEKYAVEWRRVNAVLRKERDHDGKRANIEYQKSLVEIERLEKKLRKKNGGKVGLSENANLQIEYAIQDSQNKRRYVEELERCTLRRVVIEERQRFKQFLMLLKPILDYQLSIREDLIYLEEIVNELYGEKAENLDMLPDYIEQNIHEYILECNSMSSTFLRSSSTLSRQQTIGSNGSKISVSSNSTSPTSSECNNNNVITNRASEVSSRANENMIHNASDSGNKTVKSLVTHYDVNTNPDFKFDKNLSQISSSINESAYEGSSSDDDIDISTDHNSQDGNTNNNTDLYPLPEQHVNEESQYDLPLDYSESLPPPPPQQLQPTTHHQPTIIIGDKMKCLTPQPITSECNTVYSNQFVPTPMVSNSVEMRSNVTRKFEAMTLGRMLPNQCGGARQLLADDNKTSKDESFISNKSVDEKDNSTLPCNQWSLLNMKDRESFNISPPSFYSDKNEDIISTFGTYVTQDTTLSNQCSTPTKCVTLVKPSIIRRSTFATEMQLPQTPNSSNSFRRTSTQDRMPQSMLSDRNRGRSMSVTREVKSESNCPESEEDYRAIRQKIVSRLNNELKSPVQIKNDGQNKQSPSGNITACDYSRILSSPTMIRYNKLSGNRDTKENISSVSSTKNHSAAYQPGRVSGRLNQDMESSAGEGRAEDDFDMSGINMSTITGSRKEDIFKHQLSHVLQAPKSYNTAKIKTPEPSQQSKAPSSFSHPYSSSGNTLNSQQNTLFNKSKTKSSIPSSKYNF